MPNVIPIWFRKNTETWVVTQTETIVAPVIDVYFSRKGYVVWGRNDIADYMAESKRYVVPWGKEAVMVRL